jgi:hypothetical protein
MPDARSTWKLVGYTAVHSAEKLIHVSDQHIAYIFRVEEKVEYAWCPGTFLVPENERNVPPKHRLTFNGLHGFIPHTIVPFILVKTLSPKSSVA